MNETVFEQDPNFEKQNKELSVCQMKRPEYQPQGAKCFS